MNANRAEHTVKMMCKVLKLSRTGYYKWLKRGESDRERRDRELIDHILRIHRETRGIYGAPRIHTELRANGINVGKKRVARLMREVGVCGVTRRKKWRTTIRDPKTRPAPDLVEREFQADKADQLWVSDITEIPTRSSKLYLAAVLDVWSRKVVGWSMSPRMPAELVVKALEMAMELRGYPRGVTQIKVANIRVNNLRRDVMSSKCEFRWAQLGTAMTMCSRRASSLLLSVSS